jgi:hypothetical protein
MLRRFIWDSGIECQDRVCSLCISDVDETYEYIKFDINMSLKECDIATLQRCFMMPYIISIIVWQNGLAM